MRRGSNPEDPAQYLLSEFAFLETTTCWEMTQEVPRLRVIRSVLLGRCYTSDGQTFQFELGTRFHGIPARLPFFAWHHKCKIVQPDRIGSTSRFLPQVTKGSCGYPNKGYLTELRLDAYCACALTGKNKHEATMLLSVPERRCAHRNLQRRSVVQGSTGTRTERFRRPTKSLPTPQGMPILSNLRKNE